jgi:glutathione synthase/RimK-type ligase-like ATP-grasp enzyme
MSYTTLDDQLVLASKNLQMFMRFLSLRGYSVTALDDYSLVYQVEQGSFLKYLSNIDFNPAECAKLLKDKVFTYLALERLGISTPKGTYFVLDDHRYSMSIDQIIRRLKVMTYPLVLKPNDSSFSKGINILNQFDETRATNAIMDAGKHSSVLIAQEYLIGEEYRVVAVDGEITLVLRKFPNPEPPKEVHGSPNSEFVSIVSNAMKHLGANLCAFDLILEQDRTTVLEVNSNPYISQFKEHVATSTLERYFIKLESLLRRNYGN